MVSHPDAQQPEATEVRIRLLTLPLRSGRVLHVGVHLDEMARPESLVFAEAYAADDTLRALAGGTRVEVSSWPSVRRTVEALLDADGAS
jgi:hypothetical protein